MHGLLALNADTLSLKGSKQPDSNPMNSRSLMMTLAIIALALLILYLVGIRVRVG